MPTAIVDSRISKACERSLLLRGFNLIKLPPSKRLSAAIASHPDMLTFRLGNELVTCADYCDEAAYAFSDLRELCPGIKITFTADELEREYPRDAIFNALVCGETLYCRKASVSHAVIDLAERRGLRIVNVKQGYPACTVLTLGDSHAVTADEGMARALSANGVAVTVIENGDISLPPYEYGFIGGAAGVRGDKVYFLGNVDKHRCAEAIKSACKAAKLTPVSLSDEILSDLGRIIFID